jgi:hypothetical protein
MMARKAKDTPHLRLRIEPSLLARLEKSAEKNGRTLTGEIVDRLESSFRRYDLQALVDETAERVAEKVANKLPIDELEKMLLIYSERLSRRDKE